MVISTNTKPSISDFTTLLNDTTNSLNAEAISKGDYYSSRNGNKLEHDIYDRMTKLAKGSPFEGSIQLVSGQKFPDIVARKYYGVEVKTTTQNHWKTTGNSVLESTRVDGVERIFLLFGKLAKPVEFKYRPYEECLSEVVVTHSPRYLVDMNLPSGSTIFDKISISYDNLRTLDNPIKPIIDYYKTQLKEGEELWWIDSSSTNDTNMNSMTVKLWNTLDIERKNQFVTMGLVYFPEIFGNGPKKYNRLALWLVARYGIVSTSLRDSFTAGGRKELHIGNNVFYNVPRIYEHVLELSHSILDFLSLQKTSDLMEKWQIKGVNDQNKLHYWFELVCNHSKKNGFDSKVLLNTIFGV